MKQHWQRIAARIDEMSLRQRAMLFVTVSLLVVVFAHVALIEPLLLGQKTPPGTDVYAKRGGDNKVFLIASHLETS